MTNINKLPKDIWVLTDTHFNHSNKNSGGIIGFKNEAGKPARPDPRTGTFFTSIEEHNELFFDGIREYVKAQDKVYHLGDVCMGPRKQYLGIMKRLTAVGHWRLCPGNHDEEILNDPELAACFEIQSVWRIFKDIGVTLSHIPIHHECFRGKTRVNAHGHVHQNSMDEEWYLNLCPEKMGFNPIHIDEIAAYAKKIN